jgi:hypothetical protein
MDDLRQLFHTLNNQLGIILTHAELLEAKAPDEALRKKATTVLEATMEALSTARAIRARVEAGARPDPGSGIRDPGSGESHPGSHS